MNYKEEFEKILDDRIDYHKERMDYNSTNTKAKELGKAKIYELKFIKRNKLINLPEQPKFPGLCPKCNGNFGVLSTHVSLPSDGRHNMPDSKTPIVWPHVEYQNGFQKLCIQMKCLHCGQYYSFYYELYDMKTVDEDSEIWYKQAVDENKFEKLKEELEKPKFSLIEFLKKYITRERLYFLFKAVLKKIHK